MPGKIIHDPVQWVSRTDEPINDLNVENFRKY